MSDTDVFDWQEFLELARQLGEPGGNAARLRTSISRAYYAAFHTAQAYLTEFYNYQPPRRTAGSHKDMWEQFKKPGRSSSERAVANSGGNLLLRRHSADYHARFDYNRRFRQALPAATHFGLNCAQSIIKSIEFLREAPPPRRGRGF